MSSDSLKELKRQRRDELKALHLTYLRTKRDLQRGLPGRIIRKHLGAGLGLAAIAGFLLAPKPSPRTRYAPRPPAPDNGENAGNWFSRTLKTLGPKLVHYIPGLAPHEESVCPPPPRHPGLLAGFMKALVPLLTLFLKKINVQRVVDQVMSQIGRSRRDCDHDHDPDAAPDVSVADVGTVKPSDFEEHFN